MTEYLRLLVIGISMALFLALAPSAAVAQKRAALVVGNSNYQNVARLPNPEKDATAIAKLFQSAGFDAVVTAIDVGNLDFKRAIRKFEDAAVDVDIAVIYYAGHGIEIGGINYLVPVDAKLASDRDAEDEAISLNRVVEAVDAAKRLRLVILDACRDNPFVATMKRRTALRSVSSGLGAVEPTSTDTLIAYAAKAGSTAEDGAGVHSPFTTALLDNLTIPGLDIRLAFGRIRDQVMKITGNRQEPFVYGSLGGSNVALVPAPEKPAAAATDSVKADYELVMQIGTKKAWEVFLNTYPSGFYADLAREQLAKLQSQIASLEPSAPAAPPQPAKPTPEESRAWNSIKNSSDRAALEKFIERYPNSPLARNAQDRLDMLERAAREQELKALAAREAAQRAEQERLAKEAARIAAQQRAEAEQRAKEAARLAELQAEAERRAKEAAESEKQKQEQAARIAALKAEMDRRAKELAEAERQQAELACRHEQDRLDDLRAAGSSAAVRDDLKRLSDELTCERLRPQVIAALGKVTSELEKSKAPPPPLENTPALIAAAQKELARLGCYSGDRNGKLDADTKVAVKKYKAQTEQPVTTDVAVTQSFVDELSRQKLRVCPAVVVSRPPPEHHRERPKREAKREERRPAKAEAKPTAGRQASSGVGSQTIGVGF